MENVNIYDLVKVKNDNSNYRVERGTIYCKPNNVFLKDLNTKKTVEVTKDNIEAVVGHWH